MCRVEVTTPFLRSKIGQARMHPKHSLLLLRTRPMLICAISCNVRNAEGSQLSPSALSHLRMNRSEINDYSPVYLAYGMVTIQPSTMP